MVDRPVLSSEGERNLDGWKPDWRFTPHAAISVWEKTSDRAKPEWTLDCLGSVFTLRLFERGFLSLRPEHFACAQWLSERLQGCYHLDNIRVLNLFGGAGVVSAAALRSSASVVHVESSVDELEIARQFLGSQSIEYICEDPHDYVDQALRDRQRFELIIVQPPVQQKGPGKRSWDIKVDLGPLMNKLSRLASDDFRGIWLAPQMQVWQPESLSPFLKETFPGRNIVDAGIRLATADGREISSGIAVYAYDDDEIISAEGERPPLTTENLEIRLDVYLEPALSSRRTAIGPARNLANCSRKQQDFALHWVEVLVRTHAEMGYQFAACVSKAVDVMSEEEVQEWLLAAIDAFDTTGLHAGIAILKNVEVFAEKCRARKTGVRLADVSHVLELFAHGLNGRQLRVAEDDGCFTDTETLFLPGQVNLFQDKEHNFQLYKVMVVHLWAQTWWGTFSHDVLKRLGDFDDSEKALLLFHRLELIRHDARIKKMLPGIHRTLRELCDIHNEKLIPDGWSPWADRLSEMHSTAKDSFSILEECMSSDVPAPVCYQGILRPAQAEKIRQMRIEKDKASLQSMLVQFKGDAENISSLKPRDQGSDKRLEINIKVNEVPGELEIEITLDGQPIPPPDDIANVISSIHQDLGEIPPEYLVAAGDGAWRPDETDEDKSRDVWKGSYHEKGAFLYDEWDFKRQSYRKQWCVLREIDINKQPVDFIDATLRKYKGLVHEIRRTFEVLRGEDKLLKRQPFGDDVDIDAVVEAIADVSSGLEMTDRLFTKKHKLERNIAVMFMVDMSGSTRGWINEAERESLVLLCEALEILGDRYAIYGFSGVTRKRCELYRIKHFDEPYDDEIKGRVCGVSPQDYTRMGVTIRHLSGLLNKVEARTKLLITLSDGKPDDFDGYRSEYGIEDTRRALIEARRDGIHPFCITIDTEGAGYLPHMYGAVNYMVLDDVRKLPLRVSDIYRKLTS